MRFVKIAALGLSLAASTSALAQTPPAPRYPEPVPPAKTGETGDLSQINGQLVPVGDHNQYHYDFKRWNVSSNPIGWIFGSYGASLSYGFHANVAVRGDINYFAPVDTVVTGYEIGAGVPIYFRRTYQGAFLEPGFILRHFEDEGEYGGETSTTFGPQVLVGWHWIWDSGLNIALAIGAGRNWSSNDSENHYDDEKIFANGYLRFGYAF